MDRRSAAVWPHVILPLGEDLAADVAQTEGCNTSRPLNLNRPFRMAASADGQVVAFGYPVHDFHGLDPKLAGRFDRAPPGMVSVRNALAAEDRSAKDLWTAGPAAGAAAVSQPPEPSADFPALADEFHLKPSALVPFRLPLSLAVNGDGARGAVTEYGGHARVGQERVFPRWSPQVPV